MQPVLTYSSQNGICSNVNENFSSKNCLQRLWEKIVSYVLNWQANRLYDQIQQKRSQREFIPLKEFSSDQKKLIRC